MRRPLVLTLAFVLPGVLAAQQAAQRTAHSISPGMSKTEVMAALGAPVTLRSANDYTYIFYKNSCGKRCGMNDLVVLHGDSVVDAIFRSPDRHYTGTSSSPAAIPPVVAARRKPAATGRLKPPPPNDTRPSIPAHEPMLQPAPTSKPAPKSP